MDPSKQVYEHDADGWERGVYRDIKETFKAPIINWIFRSLMANDPVLTRYLWGQVKPIFGTTAFASFSVEYRDTILSAIEKTNDVPRYQPDDLSVSPSEYTEIRRQLRTFDTVAPRLAVFFEVLYHGLHGDLELNTSLDTASTAPFTEPEIDQRGGTPTLLKESALPTRLTSTIEELKEFHGIDSGVPSIYRCLAQWPTAFETIWDDVEPILSGSGFDVADEETTTLLSTQVASLGYYPAIEPDSLTAVGFEQSTVDDVTSFISRFYHGPADTVLLTLPLYAATVGASGRRSFP